MSAPLERAMPDHLRIKRIQPLAGSEVLEPRQPSHLAPDGQTRAELGVGKGALSGFVDIHRSGNIHLLTVGVGIHHHNAANEDIRLRLYHEMLVLRSKGQGFEYIDRHAQTGMRKHALRRQLGNDE